MSIITLHSYYSLIEVHQCEIAIDVAGMILAPINQVELRSFFPELGLLSDILYLFKLLLEN